MAETSISVNVFNPGQAFACLGFLEAADVLLGDAEGRFDWSNEADVRFWLRTSGDENPFGAVLHFLRSAEVEWLSPRPDIQERDGGVTVVEEGIAASVEIASADLPGQFVGTYKGATRKIRFGYWADGSSRFSTTFKKSTNGASSYVRMENAVSALREVIQAQRDRALCDPLHVHCRTESLFRLDPRGSVDPLGAGFSPDTLRKGKGAGKIDMRVATYPICEIVAVVGLEHARPVRRSSKSFSYYAWGIAASPTSREDSLLPPVLARAAIAGSLPFLSHRCFVVEHEEVKRGGDRKMTQVTEEANS